MSKHENMSALHEKKLARINFVTPVGMGGHDGIPAVELRSGQANEDIRSGKLEATANFEQRVVWLKHMNATGTVSYGCTPFENVPWMVYGSEDVR